MTYHKKFMNIADDLSKKYTISEVMQSRELIEELKDPDFYDDLSQKKMDEIRQEIRGLVKHLDKKASVNIYTDIEDSEAVVREGKPIYGSENSEIYKRRVEKFIRENKHNVIISKLSKKIPITKEELGKLEDILFDGDGRGTKDDFVRIYGDRPLGEFIRSIIGLDVDAANNAFADFIQAGELTADQVTFIDTIIKYLSVNGKIDKGQLFESPFTDLSDKGVLGLFDIAEAQKIISIIDKINADSEVG